jgi:hypothetical protein
MVTINELKTFLKFNVQAGQSGAVTKISEGSTAQDDDFRGSKGTQGEFL